MNNALQEKIDAKVSQTTFENEMLTKADVGNVVTPSELTDTINSTKEELNTNINTVNDNLTGLINGKQDKLNASQTSAVNSGINAVLVNRINTNRTNIESINNKIPAQASSSNQLADKDFVNSSLNSIAAYFITKNANGDSFATKAELDSTTTFYSGGVERVPTRNDYCIVIKDETHDNATTRYIYNTNWEYQYTINETPLTAEQLAAINSGITSELVNEFNGKQTALNQTQMNAVNSGITADLVSTFNNKQNALNTSQLAAVNSGITQSLVSTFNQKADMPNASQLAEWNEGNLTTSLYNCSGQLVKSAFIIGRKGDVMSIAGRFILYIESRSADNPGIKINLPSSWNIPSVTRSVSYGDAFILEKSPYDNVTPIGIRPYFIDLDANSRSLNIRLTETYTNVTGRFYSFQIPLTYIKLS